MLITLSEKLVNSSSSISGAVILLVFGTVLYFVFAAMHSDSVKKYEFDIINRSYKDRSIANGLSLIVSMVVVLISVICITVGGFALVGNSAQAVKTGINDMGVQVEHNMDKTFHGEKNRRLVQSEVKKAMNGEFDIEKKD